MTELETLQRAQLYIRRLAEGIDPISDRELPEDTVLNQVRLSRCFFYVAGVLGKVIDNGGEVGRSAKNPRRGPFSITPEELQGIQVSDEPLSITQFCGLVTEAAQGAERKLCYKILTDWLADKGFLRVAIVNDARKKRVTGQGEAIGIFEERRTSLQGREYTATLYNATAQRFLIDNLPSILEERAAKE